MSVQSYRSIGNGEVSIVSPTTFHYFNTWKFIVDVPIFGLFNDSLYEEQSLEVYISNYKINQKYNIEFSIITNDGNETVIDEYTLTDYNGVEKSVKEFFSVNKSSDKIVVTNSVGAFNNDGVSGIDGFESYKVRVLVTTSYTNNVGGLVSKKENSFDVTYNKIVIPAPTMFVTKNLIEGEVNEIFISNYTDVSKDIVTLVTLENEVELSTLESDGKIDLSKLSWRVEDDFENGGGKIIVESDLGLFIGDNPTGETFSIKFKAINSYKNIILSSPSTETLTVEEYAIDENVFNSSSYSVVEGTVLYINIGNYDQRVNYSVSYTKSLNNISYSVRVVGDRIEIAPTLGIITNNNINSDIIDVKLSGVLMVDTNGDDIKDTLIDTFETSTQVTIQKLIVEPPVLKTSFVNLTEGISSQYFEFEDNYFLTSKKRTVVIGSDVEFKDVDGNDVQDGFLRKNLFYASIDVSRKKLKIDIPYGIFTSSVGEPNVCTIVVPIANLYANTIYSDVVYFTIGVSEYKLVSDILPNYAAEDIPKYLEHQEQQIRIQNYVSSHEYSVSYTSSIQSGTQTGNSLSYFSTIDRDKGVVTVKPNLFYQITEINDTIDTDDYDLVTFSLTRKMYDGAGDKRLLVDSVTDNFPVEYHRFYPNQPTLNVETLEIDEGNTTTINVDGNFSNSGETITQIVFDYPTPIDGLINSNLSPEKFINTTYDSNGVITIGVDKGIFSNTSGSNPLGQYTFNLSVYNLYKNKIRSKSTSIDITVNEFQLPTMFEDTTHTVKESLTLELPIGGYNPTLYDYEIVSYTSEADDSGVFGTEEGSINNHYTIELNSINGVVNITPIVGLVTNTLSTNPDKLSVTVKYSLNMIVDVLGADEVLIQDKVEELSIDVVQYIVPVPLADDNWNGLDYILVEGEQNRTIAPIINTFIDDNTVGEIVQIDGNNIDFTDDTHIDYGKIEVLYDGSGNSGTITLNTVLGLFTNDMGIALPDQSATVSVRNRYMDTLYSEVFEIPLDIRPFALNQNIIEIPTDGFSTSEKKPLDIPMIESAIRMEDDTTYEVISVLSKTLRPSQSEGFTGSIRKNSDRNNYIVTITADIGTVTGIEIANGDEIIFAEVDEVEVTIRATTMINKGAANELIIDKFDFIFDVEITKYSIPDILFAYYKGSSATPKNTLFYEGSTSYINYKNIDSFNGLEYIPEIEYTGNVATDRITHTFYDNQTCNDGIGGSVPCCKSEFDLLLESVNGNYISETIKTTIRAIYTNPNIESPTPTQLGEWTTGEININLFDYNSLIVKPDSLNYPQITEVNDYEIIDTTSVTGDKLHNGYRIEMNNRGGELEFEFDTTPTYLKPMDYNPPQFILADEGVGFTRSLILGDDVEGGSLDYKYITPIFGAVSGHNNGSDTPDDNNDDKKFFEASINIYGQKDGARTLFATVSRKLSIKELLLFRSDSAFPDDKKYLGSPYIINDNGTKTHSNTFLLDEGSENRFYIKSIGNEFYDLFPNGSTTLLFSSLINSNTPSYLQSGKGNHEILLGGYTVRCYNFDRGTISDPYITFDVGYGSLGDDSSDTVKLGYTINAKGSNNYVATNEIEFTINKFTVPAPAVEILNPNRIYENGEVELKFNNIPSNKFFVVFDTLNGSYINVNPIVTYNDILRQVSSQDKIAIKPWALSLYEDINYTPPETKEFRLILMYIHEDETSTNTINCNNALLWCSTHTPNPTTSISFNVRPMTPSSHSITTDVTHIRRSVKYYNDTEEKGYVIMKTLLISESNFDYMVCDVFNDTLWRDLQLGSTDVTDYLSTTNGGTKYSTKVSPTTSVENAHYYIFYYREDNKGIKPIIIRRNANADWGNITEDIAELRVENSYGHIERYEIIAKKP
jgi:hypothetical protein